jgi:hypothetical protein
MEVEGESFHRFTRFTSTRFFHPSRRPGCALWSAARIAAFPFSFGAGRAKEQNGKRQCSPHSKGNDLMSRQPLLITLAVSALVWDGAAAPSQDPAPAARTQVRFTGPSGMQIRWYVRREDGKETYSEPPLVAPARYNFRQGAAYRLKLSRIPGFPGLEVYPTLEVPHAGPAARRFLAHSAVALELTAEDFREVEAGKYLVKTVFLPGGGGPGTPLVVLRLGNRDREAPGASGKE